MNFYKKHIVGLGFILCIIVAVVTGHFLTKETVHNTQEYTYHASR